MLHGLGLGFGNLTATAENLPPGCEEEKLPEAAEIFVKAASNCFGKLCGHCCCPCCIQTCSRMNDQSAIVLTQLCGALACLGCFSCCELCCSGHDWRSLLFWTWLTIGLDYDILTLTILVYFNVESLTWQLPLHQVQERRSFCTYCLFKPQSPTSNSIIFLTRVYMIIVCFRFVFPWTCSSKV